MVWVRSVFLKYGLGAKRLSEIWLGCKTSFKILRQGETSLLCIGQGETSFLSMSWGHVLMYPRLIAVIVNNRKPAAHNILTMTFYNTYLSSSISHFDSYRYNHDNKKIILPPAYSIKNICILIYCLN